MLMRCQLDVNLMFMWYERDMDVERLGDLSEYYRQPTLDEIYENDVENGSGEYDSSEYDSDNIY